MINHYLWRIFVALNILFVFAVNSVHADAVRTDLTKLELSTDKKSLLPGSEFTAVIELTPDLGWHAYWENPGDAGLKLEMAWNLPSGVEIGPLKFTTPHLIPYEDIVSYGYDGKVTIIAEGKVDESFSADEFTIGGEAFWLICSDALCVPQDAIISHSVNVGEPQIDLRLQELIKITKADMPIQENWATQFHTDGENFTIRSEIPGEYAVIESAYLFPHSEGMIENTYTQDLSFINGEIIGRFQNAYGYEDRDQFNFVLTFKTGEGQEHAVALSSTKSIEPVAEALVKAEVEERGPLTNLGFGSALIFAFIGGIILNLMPCVFPILSLKAMSVLELSRKDPSEARMSGLIYTAGIMVTFGAIGALVSILSLGWGFHMQMPIINFLLGLMMVAIGLNLLGVYEIGSNLMGLGQNLVQNGSSRKTTFFTGVLAVVVAT
ncbi:MAG: protein-disulfide reductase DsbD family protein, partial [Emcibacteraceae bacterium]|nr:protein-disulfide reductase DsbD family protein [Emcibacteraceae bacterium]